MFRNVVERIFSDWTALKLAVDHSMGGPNSKKVAIDTVDYITQYCLEENPIEEQDIEDVLEDIMDQAFNTICEDNSIKEISALLFKFLKLLKNGDLAQCEVEYNNLPHSGNNWLLVNEDMKEQKLSEHTPSTSNLEMEDDNEWTEVKTRKKR